MTMQQTTSCAIEAKGDKNMDTENFPVGSFLIRPDLRPHVHAYYIFARAADDISDDTIVEPSEKVARLDQFEKALLDESDQSVPAVIPLRNSLKQTGVPVAHATDLLVAFRRDATKLRYQNWADLLDYCRYSASPVGRYVLALHGIDEEAWPANDALCTALQIINHIQDCADDYRELDRVYIPLDMMEKFGISPADLAHARSSDALRETIQAMLDDMEPLMELARGFPAVVPDFRLRLEVAVIASLADRLVALLRKRDPLCDCVKLSKGQKIFAGLRGLVWGIF